MSNHNPRRKHAYFLGSRNKIDGLTLLKRMESLDLDDYEKARLIAPIPFRCRKCGGSSHRYASILIEAAEAFEEIHGRLCLKCLLKLPQLECLQCGKAEPSMTHDPSTFPPICFECRKKRDEEEWVEDVRLWRFLIKTHPNLNSLSFHHLKKQFKPSDKNHQITLTTFLGGYQ